MAVVEARVVDQAIQRPQSDALGIRRAIGRGQVEGKAKTLGLRMKRRAARWRKRNVHAMASIICMRHAEQQWKTYWSLAA